MICYCLLLFSPSCCESQLFGCGTVAQVTTSHETKGEYLSINLGFALGVTFGVFVSRGVSGEETQLALTSPNETNRLWYYWWVLFAVVRQEPTWTRPWLWACVRWADIPGSSSLSTSSSKCWEPFWLQPLSACSIMVSYRCACSLWNGFQISANKRRLCCLNSTLDLWRHPSQLINQEHSLF